MSFKKFKRAGLVLFLICMAAVLYVGYLYLTSGIPDPVVATELVVPEFDGMARTGGEAGGNAEGEAGQTAGEMAPGRLLWERRDSAGVRRFGPNVLHRSASGLWELKVTGKAFERGYAIGKLSEDLLYYQEKVFVDQIRAMVPSERYLRFLRFFTALFNRNLGDHVMEEFQHEIYGISLSCTHEYDFLGTPFERQMNYHAAHDIGHALQDYMLVGCSSFAVWGAQSADSSLLVGRNFDFFVGDDFARNKQVAFYFPDSGYRFASVGWPGMTGVLSGMNETGLTVTINAAKSAIPLSAATPISLLTREILQYASTIAEAYAIASRRETFVAESILVSSAQDGRAAVIEKSPRKTSLYFPGEQRLISTNHFQSEAFATDKRNRENMRTSDSPLRYARLRELLDRAGPLDPAGAVSVLRDRMGVNNRNVGLGSQLSINQFIGHHSVVFQPGQRLMWVSTGPWQAGAFVAYDLGALFRPGADFSGELSVPLKTIPADSLLCGPVLDSLLRFRALTGQLRAAITHATRVEEPLLQEYIQTNPHYFQTYEMLGDYYHAFKNDSTAVRSWNLALKQIMPGRDDQVRLQDKIHRIRVRKGR